MRDVAVVAFVQSPPAARNDTDDVAELLVPVIAGALEQAGIGRDAIDFWASGGHDFYDGRVFSFVHTIEAIGAWPPINESHVEMDGAWAVYEAYAWLQLGQGEVALVYTVGRGSLVDHAQVLPTQLDPYYLTPLRPHPHAVAALQARSLLEDGTFTERDWAEVVARSRQDARVNPNALPVTEASVDELLSAPHTFAPLRAHDAAPVADAAAAVVLATGDRANELCSRPAWIAGLDHRIDVHYPGMRDLSRAPCAAKAAEAAGVGAARVDIAELHAPFAHQELLLRRELGLDDDVVVNPSGGALGADPVTATGLVRIGEAARRIWDEGADRVVAHATEGPCLQQNLVCVMESKDG